MDAEQLNVFAPTDISIAFGGSVKLGNIRNIESLYKLGPYLWP